MKKLGMTFFSLGIIVAITLGAKMPAEGAKFSTMVVPFIFVAFIAIIGNILWHKGERAEIKIMLEEHKDSDEFNPLKLLEKTVKAVNALKDNFDSLADMQICDEIDRISEELIHPFTDKRKTVMDILGMEKGADVLLKVAYAERYLNRVWSAASDGHRGEAIKSLENSVKTYIKANAIS